MKHLLTTTALIAGMATTAGAATGSGEMFTETAKADAIHASEFIGMNVYAANPPEDAETWSIDTVDGVQDTWESVGEIHDFVMDREGNIQSVLVDIGGFLGIGERQVALNMNQVRFVSDSATEEADDYFLVIPAQAASFEDAPEYNREANANKMSDGNDAAVSSETAQSDASDMTSEPEQTAGISDVAKETEADEMSETAAAELTTEDQSTGESERAEALTSDNNDPDEMNTMSEVSDDHSAPLFGEGYKRAETDMLTAEELTGARVYDARGEWIGEVDRLHLNDDGKIAAAIVDVGGFLGIGEKPVSLDMSELNIMHSAEAGDFRVSVNYSEDELKDMPTWND
ncbi:PRC-barrel domain-containing protein [Lutimaribacter marinistellae]|uniref:PRC-barrel domain-containing protein n=1 Tax=Lutimaribacter marinistellae TaxID=1820329 RepID=A0ABV7TL28_9RHOB